MTTHQHGEGQTSKSLSQILETSPALQSPNTAPTSPAPSASGKKPIDAIKKRKWLDKWVRLQPNHYKLRVAESQIYDFCSEFARNPSRGRTVVIYGDNGCGKSHIAKSVSRWAKATKMLLPLVVGHDQSNQASTAVCLYVNWAEVVDGFKPPRCDYQIIEDLQICTLLVVDDIGAEHDPSKLGVEKLYVMLNNREHRWNLITTNFGPAEWGDRFDNRISSRLFRNATHIDLTGVPDYNA